MDQAQHEVLIKYSSYTEAQKKATQKYRSNNKEKVNEQRKKYYQTRKEKDPLFLVYKREKAREYYNKKKSIVPEFVDVKDEVKPLEIIIPEQEEVKVPDAIVEVVEKVKEKRKRSKTVKPEVIEEVVISSEPEIPTKDEHESPSVEVTVLKEKKTRRKPKI